MSRSSIRGELTRQMLKYLRIQDFALISHLEMEFEPGLSLLTGETGSGKSILVDALGILVGERATQDHIRSGCERALLEGQFSVRSDEALVDALKQSGIEADDEILVRREISGGSRSRIFINDSLTTLSLLRTVGAQLVDIHGQQSHHELLDLRSHIAFLDRFGENREQLLRLRECWASLQDISRRLEAGRMDEQERMRRIDVLEHQIREIRSSGVSPHERENLESEKSILSNREEIFSRANEIYETLYGQEDSVLGRMRRVVGHISRLAELDGRWKNHLEGVSESLYGLEDLSYYARDYAGGVDVTPGRLDEVERRLAELDRLGRKYGHSETAILEYCDRCEGEREELIGHEDRRKELQAELETRLAHYLAHAQSLSEKRKSDARRLEHEIRRELRALSLETTELEVRFAPNEERGSQLGIPSFCGPEGIDRIEFFVSPNKGEPLRPLAKVASGGELSRMTLALKHLCGADQKSRTLVFDEVDSGIGGRVAEAVGRRLRGIARDHQVLCVTHLPQIAAFATGHYRVLKKAQGSRTVTLAQRLKSEEERVRELARMMSGKTITETTLRHAREMLALSSESHAVSSSPECSGTNR